MNVIKRARGKVRLDGVLWGAVAEYGAEENPPSKESHPWGIRKPTPPPMSHTTFEQLKID